jgi:hypothetical protein
MTPAGMPPGDVPVQLGDSDQLIPKPTVQARIGAGRGDQGRPPGAGAGGRYRHGRRPRIWDQRVARLEVPQPGQGSGPPEPSRIERALWPVIEGAHRPFGRGVSTRKVDDPVAAKVPARKIPARKIPARKIPVPRAIRAGIGPEGPPQISATSWARFG